MDPLAHLPAGSTDSSDSDRSSGAAQEDTGGIKKDAGGTADGTKLNLVTRKPTQGSDRRAAIDFATLSKYGCVKICVWSPSLGESRTHVGAASPNQS
jgi:hypothetical protein